VSIERARIRPDAAAGVQSVHRALDLVEVLADEGGPLTVAELAARAGLPAPTAHRLARTLVERGYLRQLADRTYALGFAAVPLAAAATASIGIDAIDVLRDLVDELGESANLAVLSGDHAEYVAQAPARYSMRMFTEVGRRVELHCTGVGKALLAQLDDAEIDALVRRRGLTRHTPHTIDTLTALHAEIDRIRIRGHAVDEQEQEVGVRCAAVALDPQLAPGLAISISGPSPRMTDAVMTRAVASLHASAARLAQSFARRPPLG
jgi:IclR family acetate operon transcriptional repressor